MRRLTLKDQSFIREIAYIHEKFLEKENLNYKATQMSVSLREEMIVRRLNLSKDIIIIKTVREKLLGFIWGHYEPSQDKVVTEMIYVHPSIRSKGLGFQLKEEIEKWAMMIGASYIEGTISVSNQHMIDLNEKLGFHKTHIIMKKDIK